LTQPVWKHAMPHVLNLPYPQRHALQRSLPEIRSPKPKITYPG
jgi:hypothetical protein